MLTPRVFETPIGTPPRESIVDGQLRRHRERVAAQRPDFNGIAASGKDTLPAPRRQPYDRTKTRAMVRASLDSFLHTHNYDREDRDAR